MRRGPLLVLILILAGAGIAALGLALRIPPSPRAIVLVTIDTLRADRLGALGRSPSITPHLDALAAKGLTFEQAWTVAPITVPAHATLLTGLLPSQHGLRTNRSPFRLAARERRTWSTLAESMRGAGCRTGAFVSASVLRADRTGLDAGFDVYDDVPPATPGSLFESERRGDETVERALAWVAAGDGPFLLWVHLFDPHAPYDAPAPFGAGPSHVTTTTGYDAEVAYADRCVGRLLDGLAAAGHGDAVVAVTSDHGEGLGEHGERTHGHLLHEATVRVPLLLSAPGAIAPGLLRRDTVTLRDVAPTLLTLARVALPEGMPATSLVAQPAGGTATVFAETLYGHDAFGWAQAFAVRVGNWKVVDAGPEVFEADLATDPDETSPVRHDPAAPGPGRGPVSLRDALDLARRGATGPGAPAGEAAEPPGGGGYAGGGVRAEAILTEEENRRLRSAYAAITDLPIFESGQSLLAAGAADRALVQFDELARRDPANPAARFWQGRALARLGRGADAARAFREAFEFGQADAACVESGLRASALAGTPAEAACGLAFAETARGRGVPDTVRTAILEATLHWFAGDAASARRALDRARGFPRSKETDDAIDQLERQLPQAPR